MELAPDLEQFIRSVASSYTRHFARAFEDMLLYGESEINIKEIIDATSKGKESEQP